MQIRPKLFSNQHSFDCSLLTRLFHLYQGQNCDAAQKSRIIFNENYRSTKEIVEFVSTNFYSVKNDIIKDIGNVPPPPNGHALQFHHVRGECILDDVSLTWYNMQEVTVVVETVTEILDSWPLSWGPKDSGSICTYMQGHLVRTTFRTGFVIPHNSPNKEISIKGRKNLGKAFTGDEVVVCVEPPARVISITKKLESARVLLCQLEEEDHTKPKWVFENQHIQMTMVPITVTETKIRIFVNKKMQNFIPIWKQNEEQWEFVGHKRIDVNLKYNSLFLVQVIGWKDKCLFPLGNVIDIIPISGSLSNELGVLNKELQITIEACKPKKVSSLKDKNKTHRQDMRDVITFTVDPVGAKDLDDAISVQRMGDRYKLGVHIADVASFVSLGSNLDANARQRGSTFYNHEGNHIHMFAQTLSTGIFSLLPGEDRGVVSLIFTVENKTNKIIGKPTFQFSLIKSDKQLSYEEADVIITQRKNDNVRFDTVEDCVTAAYSFAKSQRKTRLKDWKYSQPDKERLPGRQKTKSCTPLCCQEKPNHAKMKELVDKFGKVIPLSFHLKGNIVCSNSLAADVGHYSLNLMSYTKASSPIRRYMDIIVQRLIHSVISDENVPYTQKEIMTMCREFEENHKKAKRYQQKSEQIFYAVSMIKHSVSKLAFVVQADSEGNSFAVAFPLNNNIFAGSLLIMYRDLQVEDQPVYDEANDNVTLKWKKFILTRVCIFSLVKTSTGIYSKIMYQNFSQNLFIFSGKNVLLNLRTEQLNGISALNESQNRAVNAALNDSLTLIQGPPGKRGNCFFISLRVTKPPKQMYLCMK
uniref:Helicase with zinc finger domain 2-like n=1 Tax=Gouania willdenowi TaxID=441366 RepID=A0A8C5DPC2_GOUWI